VWDLGNQPIPVARYYTKIANVEGGVHVRLSPFDQRVVDVRFMNREGLNLGKSKERQIEYIFFREDFRRVYLDDIGSIEYAQAVKEHYIDDFLNHLNTKAIQNSAFNLVVDFGDVLIANVLPIILDQLNCSIVTLNAGIDRTKTPIDQSQIQTALKQMQLITTALKAQLGVRLDPGGERIFLVDDQGNLLKDITACAVMVELALRDAPGSAVAIPVNLPNIFEKIAERHSGRIIRTEIELDTLIQTTHSENVIMGGNGKGHFIFPDFQCAVDGIMTLGKLLEFLATQKTSISEVVLNLPPYYIAERKVSCVWEAKPRVMRLINEKFETYRSETTRSIRIDLGPNKWVLIVPDPDQPYFQITTEADSQAEAEGLADEYAQIVEKISPLE
jgi:mannose-1-phosphate guanylyltransferase/phosphomannomutase